MLREDGDNVAPTYLFQPVGIPCGARRFAAALLGTLLADPCGTVACFESLSDVGPTVRTLRSRGPPSVVIDHCAAKVLIPP